MNEKTSVFKRFKKAEIAGSLLLLAICTLPFFSFAKSEKIYVDASASSNGDGSEKHPYQTIGKALDKAKDGTEVHISKGTYKENIVIPHGVEIIGSDMYKVIIKGHGNEKPVVKMKDDTKLEKVSVIEGRYGVEVEEHSKALIYKASIRENDKAGIKINKGKINKKEEVSVIDSEISENDGIGIIAEKSRIVIMGTNIQKNDNDGLIIAEGSKAWLEHNFVYKNEGSGIKAFLDCSDITIKNTRFKSNYREGLEINAFGQGGYISVLKSKFWKNGNYGITMIQRGAFPVSVLKGVKLEPSNILWENGIGNISPVIRIF